MAEVVPYTSAAAADQRRKKNALDKVRANYLCSQLRLRLQYAKLKVDHGWQRQTLNEVENLYFRHSQKRRLAAASASSLFSTASTNSVVSSPALHTISRESSMDNSKGSATSATANSAQSNGTTHNAPSAPPTKLPASASEKPTTCEDTVSEAPMSPNKSTHINASSHAGPVAPTVAEAGTGTPIAVDAPSSTQSSYPPPPFNPYSPFEPNPRNPNANPNPYAHYPPHVIQGHVPPQAPYSPHHYLSKAYVSSSPFPINTPAPGSTSPSFGAQNQTYDSFWSTHASWGAQAPAGNAGAPGMASGMPAPAPVAVSSGGAAQDSS